MEQQKDFVRPGRRSRQEINALIAKFSEASMTVNQFCSAHNIKAATFHKWQARRKNHSTAKAKGSGFAEIKLDSSLPALFAEVKGIRIYQSVSAAFLIELAS